ncbi:3-dehydroshikimate dehydratase [Microdochium trichocladiopsis]|uniref:3-dehydroshikimate dehydratase n=1 Tax=Microdochium trichocladiopsis TaxID=1682393 RepID=A0A9P9BKG6_9PEZI|nr:3-dehydroshikimate dehydratase [Microdochium trichocladiopsis]KAH7018496.1 3-dehydroshikimate dehydratase [Microdochium trichocladiopsis]
MSSRPGICSISLGRAAAGHSLRHRLDMAQFHGFKGIELFHEDLVSGLGNTKPFISTPAQELAAAHAIRIMCTERGISIICLQPFWQYEGLLDRADHYHQLTVKLPLWLELAEALDTDLIQVPSNFLHSGKLSTDLALAVNDLRRMADAGLAYGGDVRGRRVIRFAYEALAWGTRCDTWEQAWHTVQVVDRPNFGLLLDTFNLAGSRVFADPASSTPLGLIPEAHKNLRESLDRLIKEVDVEKVFYVQIASAEKLAEPLVEGHELYVADQPARMSWSRSCRLFYEYLPVRDVARAIFEDLGFRGWISHEVFNRRAWDTDPDVPQELASRAAYSWAKLCTEFQLRGSPSPRRSMQKSPAQETDDGKTDLHAPAGQTPTTAASEDQEQEDGHAAFL